MIYTYIEKERQQRRPLKSKLNTLDIYALGKSKSTEDHPSSLRPFEALQPNVLIGEELKDLREGEDTVHCEVRLAFWISGPRKEAHEVRACHFFSLLLRLRGEKKRPTRHDVLIAGMFCMLDRRSRYNLRIEAGT